MVGKKGGGHKWGRGRKTKNSFEQFFRKPIYFSTLWRGEVSIVRSQVPEKN